MTEEYSYSICADCGGVVTTEFTCTCAGDLDNMLPFAYPDSAVLYRKKDHLCGVCGYPVWAHVQTETDRYFLQCGCGDTEVRWNFNKWKKLFTYGEVGDI